MTIQLTLCYLFVFTCSPITLFVQVKDFVESIINDAIGRVSTGEDFPLRHVVISGSLGSGKKVRNPCPIVVCVW